MSFNPETRRWRVTTFVVVLIIGLLISGGILVFLSAVSAGRIRATTMQIARPQIWMLRINYYNDLYSYDTEPACLRGANFIERLNRDAVPDGLTRVVDCVPMEGTYDKK